jgi:hypothetical protein
LLLQKAIGSDEKIALVSPKLPSSDIKPRIKKGKGGFFQMKNINDTTLIGKSRFFCKEKGELNLELQVCSEGYSFLINKSGFYVKVKNSPH